MLEQPQMPLKNKLKTRILSKNWFLDNNAFLLAPQFQTYHSVCAQQQSTHWTTPWRVQPPQKDPGLTSLNS